MEDPDPHPPPAGEAEARLRLLAEAGLVLSRSLDWKATVTAAARLALGTFADWCSLDVLDGAEIRRVAVMHADPEKADLARALERWPPRPVAQSPIRMVIEAGESWLIPEVTGETIRAAAQDERHAAAIAALDPRSAIVAPLAARGRTIGALSFVRGEERPPYGPDDLPFAEELARRAALAIDNAELYATAERAREAAEAAAETRDDFLAAVSHELRTPLTPILGWIGVLTGPGVSAGVLERGLAAIERNAWAQARLVDDLLDASRILSGRLKIERRPIELGPVVEAAARSGRAAAESKGVRLETAIAAVSMPVSGDPQRLGQAVSALVSNAIKFTPAGGRIDVGVEARGGRARVRVADTGEGFPPDFLPHLFERFRQAGGPGERSRRGLGVGLAIARHLVEAHDGTIRAESAGEGRGATFELEVPLRAAAGGEGPAAAPLEAERRARLDGRRVLVIEDDPDTRSLLALVLELQGAAVRTAASVREGLATHGVWHPDLVLCDIGLPGQDGYEFIRALRRREAEAGRGGRLPVLALTAYAASEERLRALEAGFDGYLAKPLSLPGLIAAIAALGAPGA